MAAQLPGRRRAEDRLTNRRANTWQLAAAVGMPLVLFALACYRAFPFLDDLPADGAGGDDWHFYKRLALSIVNGGLAMPGIGEYRVVPHGFLYNYFVAAVFAIAGANSTYVYVVQALITGAAVSILWAGCRHYGAVMAGAMLALGTTTVFIDFTNRLSFRLLSENLFLPLAAAALVLADRAVRRLSVTAAIAAGACLGLAVISRTSVVVWAMAIVAIGAGATVWLRWPRRLIAAFALAFVAAMMLMPLREYAATGSFTFHAITDTKDWIRPSNEGLVAYYGKRVAFMLGFTPLLDPEYRIRPHWMLIWLGVSAYAATRVLWRQWPSRLEICVALLIPLYLGPVLLVGGVSNYGGRMVAVAMPFAVVLAARFLQDLSARSRVAP